MTNSNNNGFLPNWACLFIEHIFMCVYMACICIYCIFFYPLFGGWEDFHRETLVPLYCRWLRDIWEDWHPANGRPWVTFVDYISQSFGWIRGSYHLIQKFTREKGKADLKCLGYVVLLFENQNLPKNRSLQICGLVAPYEYNDPPVLKMLPPIYHCRRPWGTMMFGPCKKPWNLGEEGIHPNWPYIA